MSTSTTQPEFEIEMPQDHRFITFQKGGSIAHRFPSTRYPAEGTIIKWMAGTQQGKASVEGVRIEDKYAFCSLKNVPCRDLNAGKSAYRFCLGGINGSPH